MAQPFKEAVNLPTLKPEQRHCVWNPDLATVDPHQRVKPAYLGSTHLQHRHSMHILAAEDGHDTGDPLALVVPFLSSGRVSFLFSAYNASVR